MLDRMLPPATPPADEAPAACPRRAFLERSSFSDPSARPHERRGHRWLVVACFVCPCHAPIALALLGALFGGSAIGAVAAGSVLQVALVLGCACAAALWMAHRQIRRAKRIEATARGCAL